MKYSLVVAAFVALAAGQALGADTAVTCAIGPTSAFQPQATLEAQLKAAGMTIRQVKVENGCYEVYAIDKDGKKVNNAYNAVTLEQLADAEAGEN